MATPTVRKLQLGNELRRLREAAGRTPAEAAHELGSAPAKISRLELGQSAVTVGDLKLLLEFYRADAEQVAWMVELSRDNRRRGRWSGDRATFPEWFRSYVDLERDAEDIRIVQTEVVPGLLQTEAYMRVLYAAASPFEGPVDVDAAVRSRLERQEVLARSDAPTLSCVLSESCIRRMVGGPKVMSEQLRHMAELAARPRVQIQMWPFDGEIATAAFAQRFTLLRIPAARAEQPFTFAYCEDLDDARYIDDAPAVRVYEAEWGALQAAALGPAETRSRLRELARQLT
ncbi:helix-turn-helix domain-containing protein [Pseudonocardia nigra]|uniref:helix-turn-helix domain-containing protein n=1 Tax=Pseudonocardia nigra TaxID=1921578 RepID=UPI001C5E58D4|nr:helix-turn-helix transcriptional regulator [Pseudonocardia nigra]